MTNLPKISVIVATMNRAQYLKRMLDKLFEDDYPNLEVIIIDGASKDNTVEIIKSYGNKITKWVSEPDDGEYFAFNKGLKMATGEIIKPMTDDDILRTGSFKLAADYFDSHPHISIVFGQAYYWINRNGTYEFIRESKATDPSLLTFKDWLREKHQLPSPSVFIRRTVFDKIGCFSTEFICGDTEFWVRAALAGLKMGVMNQIVVDYHITGYNTVTVKRWRIAADMVRITKKYGSLFDVMNCYYRKYIYGVIYIQLALVSHFLGIHPLRALSKSQEKEKPK
jgi:glycosyltransferase involved in cell wall biosynthesis